MTPGKKITCEVQAEVLPPVDVVVAGGGTAGVAAALASARNGARTLLVEKAGFLGGMLTGGNAGITMFTKFSGRAEAHAADLEELARNPAELHIAGGIPMEIVKRLQGGGYAIGNSNTAGSYVFTSPEDFKRELLQMMAEAGVQLRLHTLLVDVVGKKGKIEGVVLESKSGRQIVPATQFVDATGDGDLAVRAGAEYTVGVTRQDLCFTPERDGKTQPMGVMFRVGNVTLAETFDWLERRPEHFSMQPFARFTLAEARKRFEKGEMATINIRSPQAIEYVEKVPARWFQVYNLPLPGVVTLCCPSVNGLDGCRAEDLSCAEKLIAGRVGRWMKSIRQVPGFQESFLLQIPEIGVRESRHITGDLLLEIESLYHAEAFPDCIGFGAHPIDIDPRPAWMEDPEEAYPSRWFFQIPFRSLIVKGVENLLVAGRCLSATHEASGCIRPTVQCMITGEAAGTAAALAVRTGETPRQLDPEVIREQLKKQGALC